MYVGITILIGSVCHYHTAVEARPGKAPGGKAVVTKNKGRGGGRGGGGRRRVSSQLNPEGKEGQIDEATGEWANADEYQEPCVGVCHYHRELKYKRDNGITDPPKVPTTTPNPADRSTKDYGRNAKEIGRSAAISGPWPGRGSEVLFATVSTFLTAALSSLLVGSKVSDQVMYFRGGGKQVH